MYYSGTDSTLDVGNHNNDHQDNHNHHQRKHHNHGNNVLILDQLDLGDHYDYSNNDHHDNGNYHDRMR